jgi:hypothetical protein
MMYALLLCRRVPSIPIPCRGVLQFVTEHASEVEHYVEPCVAEEVPAHGQPTSDGLDGPRLASPPDARPILTLAAETNEFLDSPERLLLMLGEPGSGKSLFTWLEAKRHLDAYHTLLGIQGVGLQAASRRAQSGSAGVSTGVTTGTPSDAGVGAGVGAASGSTGPSPVFWVPVIIELRHYRTSELQGLLARHLRGVCMLSEESVKLCREGTLTTPAGSPRLLVFLDGFDELLQEEGTSRG